MQIYDERCERPNFAPCKSPLLIAHAIFLSRMTNIAVKTLVVSYQTCIFVEHHITKERLKPREQTVAVVHTESTPRLKTPKAPMVCRESEKTDATSPLTAVRPLHSQTLFFLSNMNIVHPFRKALRFYVDGFRQMTWGKTLWIIIAVKLFVMFAVLRLFFFQPVLKGTPDQKQDHVATQLSQP